MEANPLDLISKIIPDLGSYPQQVLNALNEVLKVSNIKMIQLNQKTMRIGSLAVEKFLKIILRDDSIDFEKIKRNENWPELITLIVKNAFIWFMFILRKLEEAKGTLQEHLTKRIPTWKGGVFGIDDALLVFMVVIIVCSAIYAMIIIVVWVGFIIAVIGSLAITGLVAVKLLDTLFVAFTIWQNASIKKQLITKIDQDKLTENSIAMLTAGNSDQTMADIMINSTNQTTSSMTTVAKSSTEGVTAISSTALNSLGSIATGTLTIVPSLITSPTSEITSNVLTGGGLNDILKSANPMTIFDKITKLLQDYDEYKEVAEIINSVLSIPSQENAIKIRDALKKAKAPNCQKEAREISDQHAGLNPFAGILIMFPIIGAYTKICMDDKKFHEFDDIWEKICQMLKITYKK